MLQRSKTVTAETYSCWMDEWTVLAALQECCLEGIFCKGSEGGP